MSRRGLEVACALLALGGATARADAQRVLLQLRPHVGDTLHMRLDQEMDVSRAGSLALGEEATSTTSTLVVLQRMIVEGVDSSGTQIRQVTDFMSSTTIDAGSASPEPRARPSSDPTEVRLRLAPDGAVTLLDSTGRVSSALQAALANLPVTFPRSPVKVGETWVRAMKLPAGAEYGAGDEIRLGFRLDSVSKEADTAYVSVHGPLGRAAAGVTATVGGAAVTTRGTLAGAMVIDRRRGWLTDWHATIDVQYIRQALKGSSSPPSRMRMTIVQWLRAVDRP